jgi:hypothetical protein
MKKMLWIFIDQDFKVLDAYRELGFKVSIDDVVNETYYVELDLTDFDMLNILTMVDECISMGLNINVQIEDDIYDGVSDYELISSMVSEDPLLV